MECAGGSAAAPAAIELDDGVVEGTRSDGDREGGARFWFADATAMRN